MSEVTLAQRASAVLELRAPELDGYDVRPMRRDDLDAVGRLVRAVEAGDELGWHMPLGDLAEPFSDPWWSPETDTLLVTPAGAPSDADPVAWVAVKWRPGAAQSVRAGLDGAVHPDHRRRGIGRALLAWQVARARQVLAAAAEQHLPGVVSTWVEEKPNGLVDLLEGAGFSVARTYLEMGRDLLDELPARGAAGVEFRVIGGERDLSEGARRVNNEGFAEHHGFQPFDAETWQRQILQRYTNRLDLSMVAVDPALPGDTAAQAVGMLMTGVYPENWLSPDRPEGWVDDLAVVPGYRGRGIGKALLVEAMHRYRDEGMVSAGLMADSENGTGAVGLYQAVGFRTRRTVSAYELEV